MWRSGNLDPLRAGDALDTYHHRRSALHYGGSKFLADCLINIRNALETQDVEVLRKSIAELKEALRLIEPAFERDPPAPADVLPWELPPSRWRQAAGDHPPRGFNSKKQVLRFLPRNWDQQLWERTPVNWKYRDALAVHLIIPARPEELVPGQRPSGWSPGVEITLHNDRCLALAFNPVKSHEGLYGTERTTICIDPVAMGGPARFLADKCDAAGGHIVICTPSKNAVRKALADLGAKALPEVPVTITAYVCRHQLLADLKATFGAGETVATAAGQCTDRTQSHYGYVQRGRKRKGYVSINAKRPPRLGNAERARHLSNGKTRRLRME